MSKSKKELKVEQYEHSFSESSGEEIEEAEEVEEIEEIEEVEEVEAPFAGNIEQWCLINGHNKYEISSFGRVRNNKSDRIIKPRITGRGYKQVNLCNNGKKKTYLVHKLVADAFCVKENGCTEVDHIDRCKTNNMFNNLRWTTRSGNNRNRNKLKNNTSGTPGVNFNKVKKYWRARIINNEGKRLSKEFSALKYHDALERTILWHKQKEKEFGYL